MHTHVCEQRWAVLGGLCNVRGSVGAAAVGEPAGVPLGRGVPRRGHGGQEGAGRAGRAATPVPHVPGRARGLAARDGPVLRVPRVGVRSRAVSRRGPARSSGPRAWVRPASATSVACGRFAFPNASSTPPNTRAAHPCPDRVTGRVVRRFAGVPRVRGPFVTVLGAPLARGCAPLGSGACSAGRDPLPAPWPLSPPTIGRRQTYAPSARGPSSAPSPRAQARDHRPNRPLDSRSRQERLFEEGPTSSNGLQPRPRLAGAAFAGEPVRGAVGRRRAAAWSRRPGGALAALAVRRRPIRAPGGFSPRSGRRGAATDADAGLRQ
jgi:hypothetical protein